MKYTKFLRDSVLNGYRELQIDCIDASHVALHLSL